MPTAQLSIGDWSWEPTIVVGLGTLVALYALAWHRGWLRNPGEPGVWVPSTRWRTAYFAMGVGTMWVALLSPIDRGGDLYLLSIHMVQHLLVMMVGPPLLLLGIVGLRPPPSARWRRMGSLWCVLTRPWLAALLFNAVLLTWHIPALYNTTLTVDWLHIIEHLTFIAVGVMLWWPIIDPLRDARTRGVSPLTKVGMLTLAGLPPTLLGLILCLGGAAYYDFYARAPRLWGVSALTDQQVAGVIMFGAGNLVYFVAISIVFLRMFEGSAERDEADAAFHAETEAELGAASHTEAGTEAETEADPGGLRAPRPPSRESRVARLVT